MKLQRIAAVAAGLLLMGLSMWLERGMGMAGTLISVGIAGAISLLALLFGERARRGWVATKNKRSPKRTAIFLALLCGGAALSMFDDPGVGPKAFAFLNLGLCVYFIASIPDTKAASPGDSPTSTVP